MSWRIGERLSSYDSNLLKHRISSVEKQGLRSLVRIQHTIQATDHAPTTCTNLKPACIPICPTRFTSVHPYLRRSRIRTGI